MRDLKKVLINRALQFERDLSMCIKLSTLSVLLNCELDLFVQSELLRIQNNLD